MAYRAALPPVTRWFYTWRCGCPSPFWAPIIIFGSRCGGEKRCKPCGQKEHNMRIAIIGAGVGGMAAAYDLQRAGHQVTLYEAANAVGGLAAGFKDPHWDWSVEQYYHHWFTSDKDILGLIKELGLSQKVVFPHPKTVSYFNGKFYPLDSPLAALTFPGFNFFDMARFGLVTAYLRYLAAWQPLEKFTADEWIQRYYGKNLYDVLFQPMLEGKFGPHQKEVNMAWFWAR